MDESYDYMSEMWAGFPDEEDMFYKMWHDAEVTRVRDLTVSSNTPPQLSPYRDQFDWMASDTLRQYGEWRARLDSNQQPSN